MQLFALYKDRDFFWRERVNVHGVRADKRGERKNDDSHLH